MAQVIAAPGQVSLEEYSNALFVCVGQGSPVPVVTWLQNGEAINTNSNNSRISVYDVVDIVSGQSFQLSYLEVCGVESGDGGEYVCEVENNGTMDQWSFVVEIINEGGRPVFPNLRNSPHRSKHCVHSINHIKES